MRKASKILLTIGGIFNILIAVGAMIAGLVLVIMALVSGSGAFPELNVAIQEMIEETGSDLDPEAVKWIVIAIYSVIVLAVAIVAFVMYLVGGIIALKGGKAKTKGILIANIVFSVLLSSLLVLVGSILGIVGLSIEENRKQQQPKEVEEKKEQFLNTIF